MRKHLYCLIIAFLGIMLTACTDETSPIGLNLIDDLVGTSFVDTFSLDAYSVLEDTLNTTQTSANILGHLSDLSFGNSSAGIYTQLALSGSAVNFGNNPVIDSIILCIQLSGYYGDTNSRVAIRVHQLTEALDSETKYYQTSTVGYDPTSLNYSQTGYTIRPNTSVLVDTGLYSPHLRIRLSQAFGQSLLDHQAELNSDLQNFLKGLYIEATSHTGSVGYMLITNLTSSLSGLSIYYHNASETGKRYNIVCNDNCQRFTHFDHQYSASSNTVFTQEVLDGQTELGKDMLFLQGTGGVKTRITLPYIENTFAEYDNRVVIHRAELVITNIGLDDDFLVAPNILTLQGISKDDGTVRFLPDDDYYTSSAYFGGTYDSEKREYRFRITKYIQQLVLNQSDLSNSMYLIVRGSAVRPHRLILDGTNPESSSRLRLEVAYSTY